MFHYADCSKINVSVNTPVAITYMTKTENDYVQYYDSNGVGIEAALAAKFNLSGN